MSTRTVVAVASKDDRRERLAWIGYCAIGDAKSPCTSPQLMLMRADDGSNAGIAMGEAMSSADLIGGYWPLIDILGASEVSVELVVPDYASFLLFGFFFGFGCTFLLDVRYLLNLPTSPTCPHARSTNDEGTLHEA